MNFKDFNAKRAVTTATVILFCFCVFLSTADAQTTRRKTRRVLQPIVVPTPFPQQAEPEVVSRAGDEQNRIFVPQSALPPVENRVSNGENVDDGLNDLKKPRKNLSNRKKTNEYDEKQKHRRIFYRRYISR